MANYDEQPPVYFDSGLTYDSVNPPKRRIKIMALVVLNISKLSISALLQQGRNIVAAMTGNINFKTPDPALTDITSRITALATTNDAYESNLVTAKENLTLRDNAAQDLIAGLTALAGYVQTASDGDPAIIQSAGMSIRAARTPSAVPEAVANLSVSPSDASGELLLSWDPMPEAASFEIQTSADPTTGNWVNQPSVTKSKTAVNGFTSGSKIHSRVRAVNPAGTGAWSSEIGKIVP